MASPPPLVLDPTRDPWERQPDESLTRHAQFCTYRDMGRSRSLRKAAEILTKNDRYVRDVAAAFRWRERAEAWDRHMDQLYEATWVEERRKAAEADARILGAGIGKIAQRLPSINPAELSAGDLIRLMDVTMRHRRTLFGDPAATLATDAETAERQARITTEQGMMLADVISRTCEALQAEVLDLVAGQARDGGHESVEGFAAAVAARVQAQWPGWLSRIVPDQIAAVTGEGGSDG
ncbi:hypothetical protein [Nonomuraea angiospora]|uniref:hypothetical protein n=1 Tax=Nonomuraea angiospora TaxID=46172 RepID=UPI0029A967C7|nr:hypothetical protein [Nonomuraea angiospora]MDX3100473.1 hypothetical protein [Nonomuraea angiospora]